MSRPTDIYDQFSRPLIDNFTWQLQNTVVDFEDHVERGRAPGTPVTLHYAYECPTQEAAAQLRDYILYQSSDEQISIHSNGALVALLGQTEEMAFDLPLLLKWVGYMCDAGSQYECRFDGWNPDEPCTLDVGNDSQEAPAPVEALPRQALPEFPQTVVVRIPEALGPLDRAANYEAPLSAALKSKSLGEVTGGGTQLTEKGGIAYIEVELGLANLDEALDVTKGTLKRVGAPAGTELHVFAFSIVPLVD